MFNEKFRHKKTFKNDCLILQSTNTTEGSITLLLTYHKSKHCDLVSNVVTACSTSTILLKWLGYSLNIPKCYILVTAL